MEDDYNETSNSNAAGSARADSTVSEPIAEEASTNIVSDELAGRYWRANVSLLIRLLLIWFVVSFGFGIVLADWLNQWRFFGFKLGFWFSQQGSIYFFVLLVFVYAHRMKQLERKFGI